MTDSYKTTISFEASLQIMILIILGSSSQKLRFKLFKLSILAFLICFNT